MKSPLTPARRHRSRVQCLGAQAAKRRLKAADVHPAGYPTVVAVENMGKKLEAATNGRIKMQMFPGAVLGQEKEDGRTGADRRDPDRRASRSA